MPRNFLARAVEKTHSSRRVVITDTIRAENQVVQSAGIPMRRWLLFSMAMIPCTGCTSYQLQRSTTTQAGSLADLQYQQVLNNLAMFAANPSAIPCHVDIKNGGSQVADFGSLGLAGSFGRMMGSLAYGMPSMVGSRTIVEQWGTAPVTDDTELRLLQIAYRRAFSYPDTLDDDHFADDLAHELKKQISVTDDLKDLYRLFYIDREGDKDVGGLVRQLGEVGINRTRNEVIGAVVLATNDENIIQDDERVSASDFRSSRTSPESLGRALSLSEREISVKDAILKRRRENPGPVRPKDPTTEVFVVKRATPVIQEVRRLVKETEDDIEQIHSSWFGVARHKKEIPRCACYVGYYRDHCGEYYVWVAPDHRDELSRFTLTVLNLSTLLQERQIVTIPGGPTPAPASAYLR